jgi:hypothetical protein
MKWFPCVIKLIRLGFSCVLNLSLRINNLNEEYEKNFYVSQKRNSNLILVLISISFNQS